MSVNYDAILSQSIDWLQVTYREYIPPKEWKCKSEKTGSGMWGYTEKEQFSDGRIVLKNPERPIMGTHVIMGATCLAQIACGYGVTPYDLLKSLEPGSRVTRLDVCVDIKNGCFDFDALQLELEGGFVKTRASVSHRFQEIGGEGDTIYIGSAESQKRLRIYNKAAEKKLKNHQWTRVELQARAEVAHELADMIASSPDNERIIPGAITGFVDFSSNADWVRVFRGAPVLIKIPEKEASKTIAWLLEVAAPCLARQQVALPSARIFDAFLARYEEECAKLELRLT